VRCSAVRRGAAVESARAEVHSSSAWIWVVYIEVYAPWVWVRVVHGTLRVLVRAFNGLTNHPNLSWLHISCHFNIGTAGQTRLLAHFIWHPPAVFAIVNDLQFCTGYSDDFVANVGGLCGCVALAYRLPIHFWGPATPLVVASYELQGYRIGSC
jgi:hypothetical protein